MKRRNRQKTPFFESRLGFHVMMWGLIALAGVGFVQYTRDAIFRAQHFPPDYVHPSDYYAEGCLALILIALGVILLTRNDSAPPPFRKPSTSRAWSTARPDVHNRPANAAKRRRRTPLAPHRK